MNDKELLVFAAKAAGICVEFYETHGREICKKANDYGPNNLWNPLMDDGDALRLAVNLGTDLRPSMGGATMFKYAWMNGKSYGEVASDPYAATRRAIVRAAAQIGKGMK